jgi:hypothetical protein
MILCSLCGTVRYRDRDRERDMDYGVTSANQEHMLLAPSATTMLGGTGGQGYELQNR